MKHIVKPALHLGALSKNEGVVETFWPYAMADGFAMGGSGLGGGARLL